MYAYLTLNMDCIVLFVFDKELPWDGIGLRGEMNYGSKPRRLGEADMEGRRRKEGQDAQGKRMEVYKFMLQKINLCCSGDVVLFYSIMLQMLL